MGGVGGDVKSLLGLSILLGGDVEEFASEVLHFVLGGGGDDQVLVEYSGVVGTLVVLFGPLLVGQEAQGVFERRALG